MIMKVKPIKIDPKECLGKRYLEYCDIPEEERGTTFDDFFDWVGVPLEQRNNFAVGAILNRAQKIVRGEV